MISLLFLFFAVFTLIMRIVLKMPELDSWAVFFYAVAYMFRSLEDYLKTKKHCKEMLDTLHNQASILFCMDRIHKEVFALDLPEEIQSQIEVIFDRNLEDLNDDYK